MKKSVECGVWSVKCINGSRERSGTPLSDRITPRSIRSLRYAPFPAAISYPVANAYTLIEVLVALALLVIGVSALATMTNQARQSARAAEELSSAQLACQTRVNEMLSGIRTITPSFNEAVTGLDNWFLTTELFPATKPGITAVRVHMSRRQPPDGPSTRVAGTDFFEITQWVGNSRIDPQLLQAMQQNPYALTVGGMTMANNYGYGNMMGGGMMGIGGGPTSLTDLMTANNTIPGSGFGGGMQNNMMPQFGDGFGMMPDAPPPLALDNGTGNRSTAFTTSEERRAFRESRAQNSLQTAGQSAMPDFDLPDAPPPLDIPFEAPPDANASASPATTTEPPSAASPRSRTTTTPTTPPPPEDTQPPDVPQMPDDTQGGNTSPRTPGGRSGARNSNLEQAEQEWGRMWMQ